jgi:SOS-response transcriptional repressor LexA
MNIKERLRKARTFLGLSQESLALETGSQRTTVAGYENGISLPRSEFLKELSTKYGINPNWILTGQGNMLNDVVEKSRLEQGLEEIILAQVDPKFAVIEARLTALEQRLGQAPESETLYGNVTDDPEPDYDAEERVEVPYVRDIAAGPPIRQAEDQSQGVAVPARLVKKGGRYYAASVRGTSMAEAGIRDGDTVLIRHADAPKDGAVQVVRYKGRSTLKRLREVEGKGWELHYEDGTGQVIPVDSGQYEVQGDFVAVLPRSVIPD